MFSINRVEKQGEHQLEAFDRDRSIRGGRLVRITENVAVADAMQPVHQIFTLARALLTRGLQAARRTLLGPLDVFPGARIDA